VKIDITHSNLGRLLKIRTDLIKIQIEAIHKSQNHLRILFSFIFVVERDLTYLMKINLLFTSMKLTLIKLTNLMNAILATLTMEKFTGPLSWLRKEQEQK